MMAAARHLLPLLVLAVALAGVSFGSIFVRMALRAGVVGRPRAKPKPGAWPTKVKPSSAGHQTFSRPSSPYFVMR